MGPLPPSSRARLAAPCPGAPKVFLLSQFYRSEISVATALPKKRSQKMNSLQRHPRVSHEHRIRWLEWRMPVGSPRCSRKGPVLPKPAVKYQKCQQPWARGTSVRRPLQFFSLYSATNPTTPLPRTTTLRLSGRVWLLPPTTWNTTLLSLCSVLPASEYLQSSSPEPLLTPHCSGQGPCCTTSTGVSWVTIPAVKWKRKG